MKVTKAFSSCLDRQLAEKVDIANFTGPVLMNRRTEMGGVRIERQQYRRWGVPPPYHNSAASRAKEGR